MKANFLFKSEFSVIGTQESAVCGININGHEVPFTGACGEVERFGITAEEMALFSSEADSVHFESEREHIPVRGTSLNDKVVMEEIAVLTVRAVAGGEVIKTTQISRVVSRW